MSRYNLQRVSVASSSEYVQPVHSICLGVKYILASLVQDKRQPMGINKLNGMMNTVFKGMTLEDSWKTFSNHGARKTVVKKLKAVGLGEVQW